MGGPYNPGNEVRLRDIRNRHQWAGDSEEHEEFGIYDPTYMFEWIQDHWHDSRIHGLPSKPVKIDDARGILIDARQMPAPTDEPIFMEREVPSVFVK
jgi:hypothetical protein